LDGVSKKASRLYHAARRRGGGVAARGARRAGSPPDAAHRRHRRRDDAPNWDHFRQGLRDLGYVERQNIAIEYRSAQDNVDRLTRAALELASLPTDVIVVHGSPATRAARRAPATIPVVTIGIGDPVRAGFVTNLARPDGNITGNSQLSPDLIGKRLEILKECVPDLVRVAFLWNPDNDSNLVFLEELITAVPALGLQLISAPMRTSDDFERAFAAMMQRRPNGRNRSESA
jgi:putative tryptophan/tyrosine transport system substrate-binding protein